MYTVEQLDKVTGQYQEHKTPVTIENGIDRAVVFIVDPEDLSSQDANAIEVKKSGVKEKSTVIAQHGHIHIMGTVEAEVTIDAPNGKIKIIGDVKENTKITADRNILITGNISPGAYIISKHGVVSAPRAASQGIHIEDKDGVRSFASSAATHVQSTAEPIQDERSRISSGTGEHLHTASSHPRSVSFTLDHNNLSMIIDGEVYMQRIEEGNKVIYLHNNVVISESAYRYATEGALAQYAYMQQEFSQMQQQFVAQMQQPCFQMQRQFQDNRGYQGNINQQFQGFFAPPRPHHFPGGPSSSYQQQIQYHDARRVRVNARATRADNTADDSWVRRLARDFIMGPPSWTLGGNNATSSSSSSQLPQPPNNNHH